MSTGAASLPSDEPLAIIGVGCRFPGHCNSPAAFWSALLSNTDCVAEVPPDRWSSAFYCRSSPSSPSAAQPLPGRIASTRCGLVDWLLEFDYESFGISRREAESMDPQQKLLLETALQALEDARLQYRGSNTGVYVGIGQAEQLGLSTADHESITAHSVTGSALSIAANRLSFCFDLRGPSLSVDTACSSSMTALHYAKEAVRRGECSHALVAGVNVLLDPAVMIQFSQLGVLSPDGRCKSFQDAANGYVRAEGCGAVVLTRLSTALAAHSHVYALLRGTAVNSDGRLSPSLTMPSQQAQMAAFEQALTDAAVSGEDVWYAEAHATGTKVGDPVEANAIGQALGKGKRKRGQQQQAADSASNGYHSREPASSSPSSPSSPPRRLRVGAVKTFVGHLETASFMAGLLKCLLMLHHATLLPDQRPDSDGPSPALNPAIRWSEYGLELVQEREAFDAADKLLMISSFGFGGSNGAAIIQGWKPQQPHAGRASVKAAALANGGLNGHRHDDEQHEPLSNGRSQAAGIALSASPPPLPLLFLLSAETPAALDGRIADFKCIVESSSSSPPLEPQSVSFTLATRPLHRHFSYCIASSLSSASDLRFSAARRVLQPSSSSPRPPLVWCFSGQGPQHPEMGRMLYALYPVFRSAIDDMDAAYREVSGESLLQDVGLFGQRRGEANAVYRLQYTLPSLVFLQVALCDLWRSWGLQPDAVFGHSFGEMAAAYAAGVCNKRQLVETAYHRARLLAAIDGSGVMMAVGCSAEQMAPWLAEQPDAAWIAAYNGPASITVGGTAAAVAAIARRCAAAGLFHRLLKISNAYHTPLMRPCKDEMLRAFALTLQGVGSASIPYFSTVHAAWKQSGFDAQYTWDGIESAVRFSDGVAACLARFGPHCLFMEMSAHPVLSSYLTECGAVSCCVTLNRQQHEQESVLRLWLHLIAAGLPLSLSSLLPPAPVIPLFLPYSFQRQYCHREDADHRRRREVPSFLPLAGREISFGVSRTFELKAGTRALPWTLDHVVQGAVVFPAAAYLEMSMEALQTAALHSVDIHRAMILHDGHRLVRTVLSDDQQAVSVYSKKDQWDAAPWTLHATARRAAAPAAASAVPSSPPSWTAELRSRCPSVLSKKAVYERFRSVGLTYGPLFQAVDVLQVGDQEAWAAMDATLICQQQPDSGFVCHPALLDAAFHVLLGTMRYLHLAYVPTAIGCVRWLADVRSAGSSLQVFARGRLDGDKLEGELVICRADGRLLGCVERMQCTALGQTDGSPQPTLLARWQSWQLPGLFIPQRSSSWSLIPADVLRLEPAMDAACHAYVAQMLRDVDAVSGAAPLPSLDWPLHRQRYWRWCRELAASRAVDWDAVAALSALSSSPGFPLAKEVEAVTRVGEHLRSLLSEPLAVQRVLFSDSLMSELYSQSLSFRPFVRLTAELVVELIASHPNRVMNVLELGAGTGALTFELLSLLSSAVGGVSGRIRYYFTDVSVKFLHDARHRFSSFPFIEYCLYNIDSPPSAACPIAPHSLDVVLAFDVLHVAASLPASLSSLQRLMAPNALLLSIELTRPWLWTQLVFGLFSGWWGMDDDRQRCWMDQQGWTQALQAAGYDSVQVINDRCESGGRPEFCHSIITCHAPSLAALEQSAASSPPPARPVQVFDCSDPGHDLEYLLSQAQQLVSLQQPHDFFLLTDDAQNIASGCCEPSLSSSGLPSPPLQALHVGFTRVLANEAPQHRVFMLDFEPETAETRRDDWRLRLQRLRDDTVDREFAVRGGQLFVPRFLPFRPIAAAEQPLPADALSSLPALPPFRLEIDSVGQLSSLRYRLSSPSPSSSPLQPAPGELLVRVEAAALNFKDLMLALGMLSNPLALDRQQLRFQQQPQLGIEFSGVVAAVGRGVRGFAAGDDVFGIGAHCLANVVIADARLVARRPSHLSHCEAASLPIVFCTAYAGLMERARLQPGERVLVHSGAGGIGQASIQLCRDAGADVIATVGSEAKRAFLSQRYGLTTFADSHSGSEQWQQEVMRCTAGCGVDVVVNSLKGDAVSAGLSCLSVGGRFIEIGKVDILANAALPLRLLLRDVSFLSVQLDVLMLSRRDALQRLMQAVQQLAEQRRIAPLVHRVLPCSEVEAGFRLLMQGQHTGKVVIDFSQQAQQQLLRPAGAASNSAIFPSSRCFCADQSYVLTGGTGAVALRLVQYLAARGARHFLLLSRRGESALRPSERAELSSLQRFGVRVLVTATDVTQLQGVVSAYDAALAAGFPRRVSLLHLAMVLDDDPIVRLSSARLSPVIDCKVGGVLSLLRAFRAEDVAAVVLFSSAASVLGNPAQANYAAANAFLDAYCCRLRSAGYAASVLNLGVVEDVGVLAEDHRLRALLAARGFAGGLTAHGVCALLEAALRDERPDWRQGPEHARSHQFLHGAFDWQTVLAASPSLTARFSHLVESAGGGQRAGAEGAEGEEGGGGGGASLDSLRALVAGLLGVAVDKLDVTDALTVHGLDSLLAVELSALLRKRVAGCTVSQMELLGGMTVEAIWQQASATAEHSGGGGSRTAAAATS